MFFVAFNRRVINQSRFYHKIESNSSCLRFVYIHIWISEFERLDRIVCVCKWEYWSTIYSHFARDNWFVKTFFLDEIHIVSIKTSYNVNNVIMTRNDFIIESLINNFLMSLITTWLSQYRVTFFLTKIWIQVLSAYSIACISLKFMCINRIRLEKRTKNAWSRIFFLNLTREYHLESSTSLFHLTTRREYLWIEKTSRSRIWEMIFFMNANYFSIAWEVIFSLINREITFSLLDSKVTFS
jgi:hypothetical protein